MDFRSPLGKVKDNSHAKGGSGHWISQRLTAIALIPLIIWFVLNVVLAVNNQETGALEFLKSPLNSILMVIFLATSIYHGSLGMRVVFEDYINCTVSRNFAIIFTNFVSVILVVASIVAVINFHISISSKELSTDYVESVNEEVIVVNSAKIVNNK